MSAAGVDRAPPVDDRLGVAALLEAQQAEAEGRLGKAAGRACSAATKARSAVSGSASVLATSARPSQARASPESSATRAFEHRPGVGRLAAGAERRAEVEPQRRVVGRQRRRDRENRAGGARVLHRPKGQAEAAQRGGGRNALQEQRVQRGAGGAPVADSGADLGRVELRHHGRQGRVAAGREGSEGERLARLGSASIQARTPSSEIFRLGSFARRRETPLTMLRLLAAPMPLGRSLLAFQIWREPDHSSGPRRPVRRRRLDQPH